MLALFCWVTVKATLGELGKHQNWRPVPKVRRTAKMEKCPGIKCGKGKQNSSMKVRVDERCY